MPPAAPTLEYLVMEGFISVYIKKNSHGSYYGIEVDIPVNLAHELDYSTNGSDTATLFEKNSYSFLTVRAYEKSHRDKYCTLKK